METWANSCGDRRCFCHSDGDGVPDWTEKYLGTDAHRADSDADGIPDGDDVAPTVALQPDERSRVVTAVVDYLAYFTEPRCVLLNVYTDKALEAHGSVRVVLNWNGRTSHMHEQPNLGVHPFAVSGEEVDVRVMGDGTLHCLHLRHVDDRWRVISDVIEAEFQE